MQIIQIHSSLPYDAFLEKARERKPQFYEQKGLIQKYFVRFAEGQYGGVYVWDSQESLNAYKASDLAASIPQAYAAIEKPSIQNAEVLFQL